MTTSLMDLINKKKQEIDSNNRAKTAKVPDGRSRWRILPGWRADKSDATFFHDFGAHYVKDATKAVKAVYVCTEKTFGRPCDICSTVANAMAHSHDDVTTNLLKEAGASARVLLNALQVDGATPNVPQILELAPTAFNQIITIMQEWGDILDLNTGHDIVIERSGKGIGTKYVVQVAAKSQPVSPEIDAKKTDLDKYVAQESEAGKVKAITQVNAVAGLLGSPSTLTLGGGDKPTLPNSMVLNEEQGSALDSLMSYDVATAKVDAAVAVAQASTTSTLAAQTVASNVVDAEVVPKTQPATPPVTQVTDATGDELEDLLKDLQT